jgi:hypothetical protein
MTPIWSPPQLKPMLQTVIAWGKTYAASINLGSLWLTVCHLQQGSKNVA